MGIGYQLTFFLSLTLLAVVITIFTFAVSLLGRAVDVAAKEQEEATRAQKDAKEKEIKNILKKIAALAKKKHIGQELKELDENLKQLRREDEDFAKKLRRIGKIPELLRVRGGVIYPAISLGAALTLSSVAWYLSNTNPVFIIFDFAIPIPRIIWALSIAAIFYGIYRMYISLKAVESIAITSEHAAIRREVEAYKLAQKELEDEKKPEVVLEIEDKSQEPMEYPIRVKTDSEVLLILKIHNMKENLAENVNVHFAIPPSFSFPRAKPTVILTPETGYPDYIDTIWKTDSIIGRLVHRKGIAINTPSKAGNYKIAYWIYCKGFQTDSTELEVIVE